MKKLQMSMKMSKSNILNTPPNFSSLAEDIVGVCRLHTSFMFVTYTAGQIYLWTGTAVYENFTSFIMFICLSPWLPSSFNIKSVRKPKFVQEFLCLFYICFLRWWKYFFRLILFWKVSAMGKHVLKLKMLLEKLFPDRKQAEK